MDSKRNRPISPHLTIYAPISSMVMSILHRITGAGLYAGTVLLAAWLIGAAGGQIYFDWINWIFGTPVGILVLLGYTWTLLHHMVGGLRHLIWDTGHGFEKSVATRMAIANLIGSLCLTILVWLVALYIHS